MRGIKAERIRVGAGTRLLDRVSINDGGTILYDLWLELTGVVLQPGVSRFIVLKASPQGPLNALKGVKNPRM